MNKRSLFVDDVRQVPEGWEVARNYDDAIRMLETNEYHVLSLDHDIASYRADGREMTGYDIALWLAQRKHDGLYVPAVVMCHSANAPGRRNIESVIFRYLEDE